jgi:spore germination cell wall hydrolase CwlJ-like protein
MTTLPSVIVLALTLALEGRSEGKIGMSNIASVIWRSADNKSISGLTAECLKRKRFSCWNDHAPSFSDIEMLCRSVPDYEAYRTALSIAYEMQADTFQPTIEATHYLVAGTNAPWKASMKLVEVCGRHEFYRES